MPLAPYQHPPPKAPGCVRFVCISDTHGKHTSLALPDGDVLLHCGDFTQYGHLEEVDRFCEWFAQQPHARKVLIAGNHDLTLHRESYPRACSDWGISIDGQEADRCAAARAKLEAIPRCDYLCSSGTEVDGIRIWGAPWVTPCGGVFTASRGAHLRRKWAEIPSDTDVLLTHGPPLGHGDLCVKRRYMPRQRAGCLDLLEAVTHRVRPAYHVFGHIHEGYGVTTDHTTTFVSASSCTARGQCVQPPLVFDVDAGALRERRRERESAREAESHGESEGATLRPCCCYSCLLELDALDAQWAVEGAEG